MKITLFFLHLVLTGFINAAVFNYSEFLSGDLSDLESSPTALTADLGTNTVSASTSSSNPDIFSVTILPGMQLSQINLTFFNNSVSGEAFFGYQDGSTLETISGIEATDIAFDLIGAGEVGNDLFSSFSSSANATDGPDLPAGTYTFWFNETGADPSSALFSFVVSAASVPEPSSILLLGIALPFFLRRSRA